MKDDDNRGNRISSAAQHVSAVSSDTGAFGLLQNLITYFQGEPLDDSNSTNNRKTRTGRPSSVYYANDREPKALLSNNESDSLSANKFNGTVSVVKNLLTGQDEQVLTSTSAGNKTKSSPEFFDDSNFAFKTVMSVVVVIQNGDEFCITEDVEGWFLPSGKVHVGESLEQAARGKSLHETGLDVKFTHLLKCEYKMEESVMRIKMFFVARAVDPRKILQGSSKPTSSVIETIEDDSSSNVSCFSNTILRAEWMTVKEVERLQTRNKRNVGGFTLLRDINRARTRKSAGKRKSKKSLKETTRLSSINHENSQSQNVSEVPTKARNKVLLALLKSVSKSANKVDINLLTGPASYVSDPKKHYSRISYRVRIIIRTNDRRYLVLHDSMKGKSLRDLKTFKSRLGGGAQNDSYFELPSALLMISVPFEEIAKDLMLDYEQLFEVNLREHRKSQKLEAAKKRQRENTRGNSAQDKPPNVHRKTVQGEGLVRAELVGLCGIKQMTPQKASANATGSMCFTYLVEVSDECTRVVVKDRWKWYHMDDILDIFSQFHLSRQRDEEKFNSFTDLVDIVKNCNEGVIAPVSFLSAEEKI